MYTHIAENYWEKNKPASPVRRTRRGHHGRDREPALRMQP